MVRPLIVTICLNMLAACGASPASPKAESTPFEGVWQIEYRITSCNGWRHCVFRVGKTQKILLTLSQTGMNVTGVISGGFYVDVTGTVSEAGEMTLTGFTPARSSLDHEVELTQFKAHQMPQAGMTGALAFVERGTAQGDFAGSSVTTAEIISAVRHEYVLPPNPTFEGTWTGNFVITSCTYVGWIFCSPPEGSIRPFKLTFTQTGTRVEGTLNLSPDELAVVGTVSGNSVSLQGSGESLISGGTEKFRLTAWSASRDIVGRLSGTFTYLKEVHWTIPERTTYSHTYKVELSSAVLSR
jgi:hypothetical protein